MEANKTTVQCYSGYSYAQRPQSFTWQGERRQVSAVLKEAHTPQGKRFLVQTPEGEVFSLDYHDQQDEWLASPAYQPADTERKT